MGHTSIEEGALWLLLVVFFTPLKSILLTSMCSSPRKPQRRPVPNDVVEPSRCVPVCLRVSVSLPYNLTHTPKNKYEKRHYYQYNEKRTHPHTPPKKYENRQKKRTHPHPSKKHTRTGKNEKAERLA